MIKIHHSPLTAWLLDVMEGPTIRGRIVRDQLNRRAGYSPEHFHQIHTQADPDSGPPVEITRRGAWIEYGPMGSDHLSNDFFSVHSLIKACLSCLKINPKELRLPCTTKLAGPHSRSLSALRSFSR